MRRGGRLGATLVFSCASLCACADILGIDDGTPRAYDASFDAASETTTLPDVADVAVDAPPDVSVPVSPLACGTDTCNALTQACCRTAVPTDASPGVFTCVSSPADCTSGLAVTCDESANCAALGHPGFDCCAVVPDGGGNVATSTACVAPGTCTGVVMCTIGDDEVCPIDAGETCQPSAMTILGYTICKN